MWHAVLAAVVLASVAGPVADGGRVRVSSAPILTPERFSPPVSQPQPIVFLAQPQPVPQPVFVSQQQQQQQAVPQRQPGTPSGGPLPCSFGTYTLVHAIFGGREYHFSWCRQPGATFTFQEAQDYCEALPRNGHPVGFHAVSIESRDEDSFIKNSISQYIVPFIWTSGRRAGYNAWRWQSGISSQYSAWSHTGAGGRPQPDDFFGDENCLAVLNNFYHDGIGWHDIPCDLDKYVICERPRPYGSF